MSTDTTKAAGISLENDARARLKTFQTAIQPVRYLENISWALFGTFAAFFSFYATGLAELIGLSPRPPAALRFAVYLLCLLAVLMYVVVVIVRYKLLGSHLDKQFYDILVRFDEAVERRGGTALETDRRLVQKSLKLAQPVFFKRDQSIYLGIGVALVLGAISLIGLLRL